ncbi:MDR family MFS transporter [Bacillus spongiae]|uniref:MDR family MFS transporter n=1 Tax=Bacillus spongiae TaxID=2683610 RepID=A0ABU8H9I8_9BACI
MRDEYVITNVQNKTKKSFVLASVMLAMFMGAIEATIVSTAMPAIVGDLGGFSLYSWVFSSYLLMNTVTVLIYGKLSDLFGRKPVITWGIVLFIIGSILCGLAQTMEQLILFRFIQGFGAGAVLPIASTIVGDIYSKEERAKIQGYLSSVWGISAISGPAIGGLLIEFVSWRYVFWINIPLGILAIAGIWLFLHEDIEKKQPKIDFIGAFLLTMSITSLLYMLVEGGINIPWLSWEALGLFIFSILCFSLFFWNEKNVKEPMMPFSIWRERSIFIANIVSLTSGIILIGISSYLPAFVQGVMGESPTVAGFTLTAMSVGWPIAATVAGKLLLKIGYFKTSFMGGVALICGGTIFVTMNPAYGPLYVGLGSFFVGVGMGLTTTAFIVSIQSHVSWQQRGSATAANVFMRNLGSTVGAALLGGILNTRLIAYIKEQDTTGKLTVDSVNRLLEAESRSNLSQTARDILQPGLTVSLHWVYGGVLLFAVISFVGILFLPRDYPKKEEI